jgi:hypothetical protein
MGGYILTFYVALTVVSRKRCTGRLRAGGTITPALDFYLTCVIGWYFLRQVRRREEERGRREEERRGERRREEERGEMNTTPVGSVSCVVCRVLYGTCMLIQV